jgi:hypothetical protein
MFTKKTMFTKLCLQKKSICFEIGLNNLKYIKESSNYLILQKILLYL